MLNYRSRFTYLWLIIVACCVVTKPVVAAPVTAKVITIKCNGVYKQILLIGVQHSNDENDAQCFAKLSKIIDFYREEHKHLIKKIAAIPVLLEAPCYNKSLNKEASLIEFNLARKYIDKKNCCPFSFSQADERGEGSILQLLALFDFCLQSRRVNGVDYTKSCGSLRFYKELYGKAVTSLTKSLDDLKGLGLPVNQQKMCLQMLAMFSNSSFPPFAKLYADVFDGRKFFNEGNYRDSKDMRDIVTNLRGKTKPLWQKIHMNLTTPLANAFFFSKLVTRLTKHDKIILFCGEGHAGEMVSLFKDFGGTVEDIESYPYIRVETDQKYIDPSRLQEIFTDFLDCCNTCGKTKRCLPKGENMKECPCKAVTYCSRACQKADWKKPNRHSQRCTKKKKKKKQ